MILPKYLQKKIERISGMQKKADKLRDEIDNDVEKLGFDVIVLREEDAEGYVDAVDYGTIGSIKRIGDEWLINGDKSKR